MSKPRKAVLKAWIFFERSSLRKETFVQPCVDQSKAQQFALRKRVGMMKSLGDTFPQLCSSARHAFQSDLPYVIVPMFLAMVSLTLWMLIKGVDRAVWDARSTGC